MLNLPGPYSPIKQVKAPFTAHVDATMADRDDGTAHSFGSLTRKATLSSVSYVPSGMSPNQSITSSLSSYLTWNNNRIGITASSPYSTKQFFSGATGLPMAPVSPTKEMTRIATKSSLRVLDANNCNNELATSKLFLSRFSAAATTIQKIVRGTAERKKADQLRIIHKSNQAAAQIQALIRRVNQRKLAQKDSAATKIQAFIRAWHTRLNLRVYNLEFQLQKIETTRTRQLAVIEEWKEKEMKEIRQFYGKQAARTEAQARQSQETLDKANKIISLLRRSNKKLRDKNEVLKAAIDQMLEENQMLVEQSSKFGKEGKELLDGMFELNSENTMMINLLAEFEERKRDFEKAIESRDDNIMYENRVGRLYLNTTQALVVAIEDGCDDHELLNVVEEMYLKLDVKSKGIEETEFDLSESA